MQASPSLAQLIPILTTWIGAVSNAVDGFTIEAPTGITTNAASAYKTRVVEMTRILGNMSHQHRSVDIVYRHVHRCIHLQHPFNEPHLSFQYGSEYRYE